MCSPYRERPAHPREVPVGARVEYLDDGVWKRGTLAAVSVRVSGYAPPATYDGVDVVRAERVRPLPGHGVWEWRLYLPHADLALLPQGACLTVRRWFGVEVGYAPREVRRALP